MPRIFYAFVIAALAITLTGCGAGLNASTRENKQVTDGVEASVKDDDNNIKVLNLLVIAAPGGNAVLVGTIVNAADKADALLGVAIGGSVATLTGTNDLLKNTPVIFEGDRANAKAVLAGFGAAAGTRVKVTLFLARAGEITVDAIVRQAAEEYADITAGTPMASPSPTASK